MWQLPILRGLLLRLNKLPCGRRTLAHYVPLRLNVEFHKLLAYVVGGLAFWHVWAHFMNFAQAPAVRCVCPALTVRMVFRRLSGWCSADYPGGMSG